MKVSIYYKKHRSGNQSLYLTYTINKKQVKELLEITLSVGEDKQIVKEKKRLAEQVRAMREMELLNSINNIVNLRSNKSSFYDFLNEQISLLSSKSEKQKYKNLSQQLEAYSKKRILFFGDLTENFLIGFKNHLDAAYRGDTSYGMFRRLKKVLRQAVRAKLLQSNPAEFIDNKNLTGQVVTKQVPDKDDLRKLKICLGNNPVRRAMMLSAVTGFGVAELRTLKGSSVNKKKMQITATRQKISGRNARPVVLDITPSTLQLLGDISHPDLPVFILPATNGAINDHIRSWCADAKVKKRLTSYSFRHAFATQLLEAGVSEVVIAKMMGHADTRMLHRYARPDNLMKDAIRKIS